MSTPALENLLYEFGPFVLDLGDRSLRRDGEVVSLSPKALRLLTILVEHRGRIVEKDYLLNTLWPDVFVEESSLTQLVFQLRKTLCSGRLKREYIETVPKRGRPATSLYG